MEGLTAFCLTCKEGGPWVSSCTSSAMSPSVLDVESGQGSQGCRYGPCLHSQGSLQWVAIHLLPNASQRNKHTKICHNELVSNKRAAKDKPVLAVTEEENGQERTTGYNVFRNSLYVLRTLFISSRVAEMTSPLKSRNTVSSRGRKPAKPASLFTLSQLSPMSVPPNSGLGGMGTVQTTQASHRG